MTYKDTCQHHVHKPPAIGCSNACAPEHCMASTWCSTVQTNMTDILTNISKKSVFLFLSQQSGVLPIVGERCALLRMLTKSAFSHYSVIGKISHALPQKNQSRPCFSTWYFINSVAGSRPMPKTHIQKTLKQLNWLLRIVSNILKDDTNYQAMHVVNTLP